MPESTTTTKKVETTSVTIAGRYTITVDASDGERVTALKWTAVEPNHHGVTFAAVIHQDERGPVYQLLAGFILGVSPNTYAEQIDRSYPWNYTRANLRVYTPPSQRRAA